MSEEEVISQLIDRRSKVGIPRERRGVGQRAALELPRRRSDWRVGETVKPKPPAVWNASPAIDLEDGIAVWGQYPRRFAAWAERLLGCDPREVLHVCSGALTSNDVAGVRVDIRPEVKPDVIADGRCLPFGAGTFGGVLIDPPYTIEYARDLYGVAYPRPSHLLDEAVRVVRPGGRFGMLHFLVPNPPKGASIVGIWGITQGTGYRIRAFTLYERAQDQLPGFAP